MAGSINNVQDLVTKLMDMDHPIHLKELAYLFSDESNTPDQVEAKLKPLLMAAIDKGLVKMSGGLFYVETNSDSEYVEDSSSSGSNDD